MRHYVLNILCCIGIGVSAYWYFEPFPYKLLEVDKVIADPDRKGAEVYARAIRTQACPYIVERTVTDSKGRKVYSENSTQPTPKQVNVLIKRPFPIVFSKEAKPGDAIDEVRIGAMCNPVQRIFPNWGDRIVTSFEVR